MRLGRGVGNACEKSRKMGGGILFSSSSCSCGAEKLRMLFAPEENFQVENRRSPFSCRQSFASELAGSLVVVIICTQIWFSNLNPAADSPCEWFIKEKFLYFSKVRRSVFALCRLRRIQYLFLSSGKYTSCRLVYEAATFSPNFFFLSFLHPTPLEDFVRLRKIGYFIELAVTRIHSFYFCRISFFVSICGGKMVERGGTSLRKSVAIRFSLSQWRNSLIYIVAKMQNKMDHFLWHIETITMLSAVLPNSWHWKELNSTSYRFKGMLDC